MLSALNLEWALETQARTASPLSVILIASGLVHRQDLYQVLSEIWRTPYIDLVADPPHPGMLDGLDPDRLAREGWVPVRHLTDGTVLIAGPYAPQPAFLTGVAQLLGRPVTYNITTEWDTRYALQHSLREELLERAALGLWRRAEAQSARQPLFARQRVALAAAGTALAAALVLWPLDTVHVLTVLVSLSFLASVAFKFTVCMAGARRESEEGITAEDVAALRDEDLPTFTVLAPMFG